MWQFSSPEIAFGEDALYRLDEIEARKAVVITDPIMIDLGFWDQVKRRLSQIQGLIEVFDQVEPEPSIQTVHKAQAFLNDANPDLIIALGGGSVLDVAKTARFLYERPDVSLEEISIFTTYQPGNSQLITIPSTSGTGADVTVGVVLTDSVRIRKIVVYARELMPTMTIVDPCFTLSMSPQLTADSGMDALSHAIEALSTPWHNDFADGPATKAVQLIMDYLPRAHLDGSDFEARQHMHNASTLAGLAITNSSIALGHALAHSLGAVFKIPHGRAIGLLLPYSIEYTANGDESRYLELANFLGLAANSEREAAQKLVDLLKGLAGRLGQPLTIQDLSIARDEFENRLPDLVAAAAEDHQMLTTYRVPSAEELAGLFWCAFDGTKIDF